jgi:hypothetical protein
MRNDTAYAPILTSTLSPVATLLSDIITKGMPYPKCGSLVNAYDEHCVLCSVVTSRARVLLLAWIP